MGSWRRFVKERDRKSLSLEFAGGEMRVMSTAPTTDASEEDVDECPACGEVYDERKLSASHALSVSHDPPSNVLAKTRVVMPDSMDALVVYLHRDV